MPYLPDVARLEWAIDEANRAADSRFAPDAVLGALSSRAAEELSGLRLRIEPSCRLVASEFPLLRIWQVNQPEYGGDLQVDFAAGPDHLRIRRELEGTKGVVIERLPAGDFAWLSALSEGATLAEAIERAREADGSFDLQTALQAFIGDGTIAGLLAYRARLTEISPSNVNESMPTQERPNMQTAVHRHALCGDCAFLVQHRRRDLVPGLEGRTVRQGAGLGRTASIDIISAYPTSTRNVSGLSRVTR